MNINKRKTCNNATTCITCTDKNINKITSNSVIDDDKENKNVNIKLNDINVDDNFNTKLSDLYIDANNKSDTNDITESLYIIISILEIGMILDYLNSIDLVKVLSACKTFMSVRAISPEKLDSILDSQMELREQAAFDLISGPIPLHSLLDLEDLRSVFSRLKCCWTMKDFYNTVDEITFDNQFVLRGIFASINSNVVTSVAFYISRGSSNATSVTINPTDKLCDECKHVRCDNCSPCENCDVCRLNHCYICMNTELCDYCYTQLCESCNQFPFLCCSTCGGSCCNNCQEESERINHCCDCKRYFCFLCTEVFLCGVCDKVLCESCNLSSQSKILDCNCFCGCDEERCIDCGGVSICSCSKVRCENCEIFNQCSSCNKQTCSDCDDSSEFNICPYCDEQICCSCLYSHKLSCLN